MSDELYIIGHQNPDTDSIVAAIAYAYFKTEFQDKRAIPSRCGKINGETAFVLDYFKQEEPILLEDVKPRARDMLKADPVATLADVSLREAGNQMRQLGIKTLAVVDDSDRLLGLLTVGDLARLLLEAWDIGSFPMDEPVGKFMRTENLVVFQDDDLVEEIKPTMLETRFRNYPVVDANQRYLGMVSRYNLLALRGKKLVLVDHNEKSQAVHGVEQAEVLEIIDHHRIADVETPEPIMMRNEPVGSTATIISKIYNEHEIVPPPKIAGLLCAAILSDTLIFKSPTTTFADKKYAAQMAAVSGLDMIDFGKAMFRAGSTVAGRTGQDILFEDFKEFHLGSSVVGIGQIEVVDADLIKGKIAELLAALQEAEREKGYDLVILMLTDLMRDGTELLFTGRQSRVVEKAFNAGPGQNSIFLPGVMSRKKQVVPPLSRYLQ
ncbi:putative manganese-dependent inorganic diphosphatase [Zhaonella formicivorans]|uniref:putative manganese-dependent inorganic diphosphatase n=1 Tax=Zhaonella formicivorans TaxID=2528593 RepID=UPI0010E3E338|nr:putative manganese-dependent inorganic diphosphatase [Zhaonella formicivorans]